MRKDRQQSLVAMALSTWPRREGKTYARRRAATRGGVIIPDEGVRGLVASRIESGPSTTY
jgi:hypothetical protein